jgi:hypothetical protein
MSTLAALECLAALGRVVIELRARRPRTASLDLRPRFNTAQAEYLAIGVGPRFRVGGQAAQMPRRGFLCEGRLPLDAICTRRFWRRFVGQH